MIFDSGKKMNNFMLGYDLGDEVSQISYLASDSDAPETLSVLAGAEMFNIPTILCKRKGVNQWFYGKDAAKKIASLETDMEVLPVTNLVTKAKTGEKIHIDDRDYDPVSLLTLFIKRSLSLLSMEMSLDHISSIMFTTASLDKKMIEILSRVTRGLDLANCVVLYQSYEESFFYYMLYQPTDLWTQDVLAIYYNFGTVSVYELEQNRYTSPIVITVGESDHDELAMDGAALPSEDNAKKQALTDLDDKFMDLLKEICNGKTISSVFLLGDGFKEKWMSSSLEYLCRNRRVFQGNNLFSKGASIAAKERMLPGDVSSKYVLLGEDKLKYNIGMNLYRQGKESYYALMDAGINWYEVSASLDIILEDGNSIDFVIVPISKGKERSTVTMELLGLPERERSMTRLHVALEMSAPDKISVKVADMGFGELVPSEGLRWDREIEL